MEWDKVNRRQWAKTRTLILQRDGGVCRIQLPGCTHTATQVDHIIPLHQGGRPYDPNNLRAACWNCNRHRHTPTPPTTTTAIPHHEPW